MIKDYWIEEIGELREFKIIGEVEDSEFEKIKLGLHRMIDNQFIQSSNEEGIKRWEDMLNIQPFGDDTLEGRKFRVLAKWSMQRPYSYKRLVQKLDNLVGEDGYTMEVQEDQFKVIVRINLGQKRMLSSAGDLVRETIPANMIMDIELRFNRFGDVKNFDYEFMKRKTYHDIKEEVLY